MSISVIYCGLRLRSIWSAMLAPISEVCHIYCSHRIVGNISLFEKIVPLRRRNREGLMALPASSGYIGGGFTFLFVSFHFARSLWSICYLFHPPWDQKDRPSQAWLQSARAWAQEHHCPGLPLQPQPALLDRRGGGQDLQGEALRHRRYTVSLRVIANHLTVPSR